MFFALILRDVSLKIGMLLVALGIGFGVLKAAAGEKAGLKALGYIIGIITIIIAAIGIIYLLVSILGNWSAVTGGVAPK
jgi:hypothetical protein